MCIFCERAQNQLANGITSEQKRKVEQCEKQKDRRVKATILTGFLGAGKTTFLNFVLKSLGHGQRIGVVQNEFGSVPVDDVLTLPAERSDAEVVTMPNGCLCCRVRGDLVEALHRLAAKSVPSLPHSADGGPQLDALIIECSGLSEVMPVAQTFFADAFVQASFQLDGIVCVCDASTFERLESGDVHVGATGAGAESADADVVPPDGAPAGADIARLLREQLAISDVCLLNKCDMVSSAQRDRISQRVREIRPSVRVVPCRHGKVNLTQVLKVNSFCLDSALVLDAHFLDVGAAVAAEPRRSVAPGRNGSNGRSLGLLQSWSAGKARAHAHNSFSSLGLEMDDEVDIAKLKAWLRSVVEQHGERLVRIKGVLRAATEDSPMGELTPRIIVQGVGGHIEIGEEAAAARATTSTAATGRLVFIGRLDDELRESLQSGLLATTAHVLEVDQEMTPKEDMEPISVAAAS